MNGERVFFVEDQDETKIGRITICATKMGAMLQSMKVVLR
jgi:hypothetical protein